MIQGCVRSSGKRNVKSVFSFHQNLIDLGPKLPFFNVFSGSVLIVLCSLPDSTLILTFLTRNSRKRSSRWFTGLRLRLISVLSSVYCLFCDRLIYKLEISFNCLPYQHVTDYRTTERRVKFVQSLASIALWKTDKTFRMRWILNGAYFYECISSELFVLR